VSTLILQLDKRRGRLGLKGPRAADWLTAQGMELPAAANTWTQTGPVLVARLGTAEFFLEDGAEGTTVGRIAASANEHPSGVYPVLREDWAVQLGGEGVHEVLAQVCNVDFASLALDPQPLVMTLMIGVAVLVVPRMAAGERVYRIWCDPTFGPYMSESLGTVVSECGGRHTGVSQ
jgi:sarcosine oxidase subunit gamma